MNLIKLLPFIILFWSCENNRTTKQNQPIIQNNKVEVSARQKHLLEIAVDKDSVKVNGERVFKLSKKYLIKIYGRPDSTSNNFDEEGGGYGTYETLYWSKTSYTAFLFDIADFEKEIKKSPNQYHWELIDLSEGHNVRLNGFLIDKNTDEQSIAKQFPEEYKEAISEKKIDNQKKSNSNIYIISLYTKSKNAICEDSIRLKIEDNKVTQIRFVEFID